jgi:S-formylglutathione hydrolase FrmB
MLGPRLLRARDEPHFGNFLAGRKPGERLQMHTTTTRRLGIALTAVFAWLAPAIAGQVQQPSEDIAPATVITVPSASLGSEQVATVLLPASYATSDRRYPVLYLLHGGGQNHLSFATRSWFRSLASRGMIVVTPGVGDSWYVNSVVDPKAKYEDFVVKDLVGFVDARYRTLESRESRAVAGVSMGAWGAMMLGLKHHRLFGAVGAFSAPFGISRQDPKIDMTSRTQQRFGAPDTPERRAHDPVSLLAAVPAESVPLLYVSCGNQDLFVVDNRRFVERLTERKIAYEYHELSPFGHSWDVWDGQLTNFVDQLSERWSGAR